MECVCVCEKAAERTAIGVGHKNVSMLFLFNLYSRVLVRLHIDTHNIFREEKSRRGAQLYRWDKNKSKEEKCVATHWAPPHVILKIHCNEIRAV